LIRAHVQQALQAFKALKVNGWEAHFTGRLTGAKKEEMRCWGRAGAWLAVVNVSSNPSVDVISLAVVSLYTASLRETLTPAVLAAYWVLLALLHGKIFEFPHNMEAAAQGFAALARFETLLLAPSSPLEQEERQGDSGGEEEGEAGSRGGRRADGYSQQRQACQQALEERGSSRRQARVGPTKRGADGEEQKVGATVFQATNASFGFPRPLHATLFTTGGGGGEARRGKEGGGGGDGGEEREAGVLREVSVTVGEGELVAVTGPVGSGKSTLLLAMLGELQPIAGEISPIWRGDLELQRRARQRLYADHDAPPREGSAGGKDGSWAVVRVSNRATNAGWDGIRSGGQGLGAGASSDSDSDGESARAADRRHRREEEEEEEERRCVAVVPQVIE